MNDKEISQRRSFRSELLRIHAQAPQQQWLTLMHSAGEHRYSIDQLIARVGDYADFYCSLGVQPNDLILIILKESLDLFASFFAAIIIGALPAYYAYPSPKHSVESFIESVENLIRYNEIKLVISFTEVIHILKQVDRQLFPSCIGFYEHHAVQELGNTNLGRFPIPSGEAFLQFSSGTTGAKKGVKISIDSLFNQIEAYSPCVEFTPQSKVVSWLPHYHDMGLIACMLMPFLKTVPIVMMSPFEWVSNPKMLFEAITNVRGTHVWLPNFALGHLTNTIRESELGKFDLSCIKQLVCCSEPLLYETVKAFLRRFKPCGIQEEQFYNCYAMAENTFAVTSTQQGGLSFLQVDAHALQQDRIVPVLDGGRTIASAGFPLDNVQLRIVDSNGSDLGENAVGEVWLKSNCMLEGYHNNPAETQAAFADGWYKTGDLGFIYHGELYITGRKKDIMIIGGVNIYPQDVELILNAESPLIPGRNVVFGVNDERLGTERVVVLAEVKEEDKEKVDPFSIAQKIFRALDISVSEFLLLPPMTLKKGTAGKISRYLNKQLYLQGVFDSYRKEEKATENEEEQNELKALVSSVIPYTQKPPLEAHTPLFASGLIDSFGFAELLLLLEKHYQLTIPDSIKQVDYFQTLTEISKTLEMLKREQLPSHEEEESIKKARQESFLRLSHPSSKRRSDITLLEWWIIHFPLRNTPFYRWLLRMNGVVLGARVAFLGRFRVKMRGKPGSILIGNDVVLGDGVDLRTRENGKIILSDTVYLDSNVRIVAAREGMVQIGYGTEIGLNTVINSGGITQIGNFCMIAGNVNINASAHGVNKTQYIKDQPHAHGTVEIGDDVWIGAGSSIVMNSKIGEGAVISSNSLVSGEIPPFGICAGIPAKIIRYRSKERY